MKQFFLFFLSNWALKLLKPLLSIVLLALILIASTNVLYAQGSVTGQVLDDDNAPLPGVTVQVEGTDVGTITDVDGQYTIQTQKARDVLIFSFVGMLSQKIPVENRTRINVVMQLDAVGLEEVVAIGYSTVKSEDLTGSVGSVKSESIIERGSVAPMEALQGQVAGVQIGRSSARADASFDVQIRGQNSLSGGSPLFIVDGIPMDDIEFLNPDDISRMDILKDASATAVYGSRGSNGVVIVTTKGASDAKEGVTKVVYSGYYGVKTPTNLPNMMDAAEWWEYRKWATTGTPTNGAEDWSGEQWEQEMERRIAEGDYYDWPSLILENGFQTNHNLTVSGGNQQTTFLLGVGFQKDKGLIEKDWLEKYTTNLSINHNIAAKWTIGGNIRIGTSVSEIGGPSAIRDAYRMPPLAHPYDETEANLPTAPNGLTIFPARAFTGVVNPLLDEQNTSYNDKRTNVLGNMFLKYEVTDWLTAKTTFAPSLYSRRRGRWDGLYSAQGQGDQQRTRARIDNGYKFNYTWDNQLDFQKKIGSIHNIQGTLLNSLFLDERESYFTEVRNLPYETSFYDIGSASDRTNLSSSYEKSTLVSFMGRFNYELLGKYMLTLSGRWDGSSKLAEGHKWAFFPSAALAWRASEEDFLKDINAISNLKFRLSYGSTGNNNIDPYTTNLSAQREIFYDFNGTLSKGFGPTGIVNNQLTWERTQEVNLGIDYGFLKNRIGGSVDLYNRLSDGLLIDRNLPAPIGWETITDNVGSVRNKGIELLLRGIILKTKDFSWEATVTFARNKNEIVETINGKQDDIANFWFIGQPVEVNYTYVFDGIWQLGEEEEAAKYGAKPGNVKVKDLNDDGKIDGNDRQIIGSAIPDWTGGINTKFIYKNFDVSAYIYTEQGAQKFSWLHNDLIYRSRNTLNHNYWTPDNPSNEAPLPLLAEDDPYWGRAKLDGAGLIVTDRGYGIGNYKDVSFIRVQNIILGYTFPRAKIERFSMSYLRVYCNITNPFVFTNYDGFDPEWAGANSSNYAPAVTTYQLGVNINF